MPRTRERQQAAATLLDTYLAILLAESHVYPDTLILSDSDSDSESSESSSDSSEDDFSTLSVSEAVLAALAGLYLQRYLANREPIQKSRENFQLLLTDWKANHPKIFRSHLGITPACFDLLVEALKEDSVFHNQSHADQIPVQDQVAIALYRFRHYGNGATIMKVALWAGIGFGTVRLVTNHVMKAVCSERFCRSALHWPDSDTKERAKAWVEEHSCPAWRDGWCMVDGTLIPLHAWPAWYGNTWFDRKSNYSLNVQVCDYDLS